MSFKKWAVPIVLFAGAVVLSLVLLTFLAVQIQQRTLRWRAERLSADMHQIRLYQSTWADAQRLMNRWERGVTTTEAARLQAYVGCYAEGVIDEVDVTSPSNMKLVQDIPGIYSPQRLKVEGNYLLVTSSVSGGSVYQIDMGPLN
jgi:hypothetical protein